MPSHRRHRSRTAGFTLIDTMVSIAIIAILAAIILPQFAGAREEALEGNLSAQLYTIRNQIKLYNLAHPERPFNPLVPGGAAAWSQLVDNEYLQAPPENPLQKNSSKVRALPMANFGWVWRNIGKGLTIYAVNEKGNGLYDGDGDGVPD